jgi:hypothetical protein
VVVSTQRVTEGPGILSRIDAMPPFTDVDITSINPYGRVVVAASGPDALAIANTSSTPVTRVEINWRVRE